MQQTTNYQLPQWEAGDRIRRGDFNGAMSKLDTALAGKADASALAALSAGVGSKGKNIRVMWGSYTGTGTYGKDNPITLTFDFYPVLVMLYDPNNYYYTGNPAPLLRGCGRIMTSGGTSKNHHITLTWGEKSVSWYGESVYSQNSMINSVYTYYVFGYDE